MTSADVFTAMNARVPPFLRVFEYVLVLTPLPKKPVYDIVNNKNGRVGAPFRFTHVYTCCLLHLYSRLVRLKRAGSMAIIHE